jgi:hypothetical protein
MTGEKRNVKILDMAIESLDDPFKEDNSEVELYQTMHTLRDNFSQLDLSSKVVVLFDELFSESLNVMMENLREELSVTAEYYMDAISDENVHNELETLITLKNDKEMFLRYLKALYNASKLLTT